MSDFQLQIGDLATRLSRAFGITGKISTQMRDPVLPVAIVQDLSIVPYADAPIFYANFQAQTGAAGQSAYVGFLARAPRTTVVGCSIFGGAASTNVSAVIYRKATGLTIAGGPYGATSLLGISQGVSVTANTLVGTGNQSSVSLPTVSLGIAGALNLIPGFAPAPIVLAPGDAFLVICNTVAGVVNSCIEIAEYPR